MHLIVSAVLTNDGILSQVKSGWNDIDIGENERLWIELNRAKCKSTLICCLYRAPNADFTKFISSLENCMPTLNFDRCDIIILGDMNVDLLLKPAYGASKICRFCIALCVLWTSLKL